LTLRKVIVAVAAQQDGAGIGRIRLRCLPDVNRTTLHGFIGQAVEPGSTVITDGFNAYRELAGYKLFARFNAGKAKANITCRVSTGSCRCSSAG
jgi:hypothetical protein